MTSLSLDQRLLNWETVLRDSDFQKLWHYGGRSFSKQLCNKEIRKAGSGEGSDSDEGL